MNLRNCFLVLGLASMPLVFGCQQKSDDSSEKMTREEWEAEAARKEAAEKEATEKAAAQEEKIDKVLAERAAKLLESEPVKEAIAARSKEAGQAAGQAAGKAAADQLQKKIDALEKDYAQKLKDGEERAAQRINTEIEEAKKKLSELKEQGVK